MNLKEKIKHLSTKLKERKLLRKWKSWTKEKPLPNYLSPKILPHFHQDQLPLNDRNLIYIGSLKKKKIKKVEDQDKKNISQTENTENSQETKAITLQEITNIVDQFLLNKKNISQTENTENSQAKKDANSPKLKKDLIYTKASPVSSFAKRTLPVMVAGAIVVVGGYKIFTQDDPPNPNQDFQDGDSLDTGDDEIIRDDEGNIIVTPPITDEDKNQYVEMLENYLITTLANRGDIQIDSISEIISITVLPYDQDYDRLSIILANNSDKYEINFILDQEATFDSTGETSIGNFVDFLQKQAFIDSTCKMLEDENGTLIGQEYCAYENQGTGDDSREFEFVVIPYHTSDDGLTTGYYRALSSQVSGNSLEVLLNQLQSGAQTPFTYFDCEESEECNNIADLFNSYKQDLSQEIEQ